MTDGATFITGRAVEEWIGATPDTPVPDRVKLRVFRAYDGRCYLTGVKIKPTDAWEAEHMLAVGLGGENRESNLAPALKAPHAVKTTDDTGRMRKADRVAKKHFGIKKPSGRGFRKHPDLKRTVDGQVVPRQRRSNP